MIAAADSFFVRMTKVSVNERVAILAVKPSLSLSPNG
jgi:hypothetical protein